MAEPPPADLMQWSKPALVNELNRLRAVTREHAEQIHSDSPDVTNTPIMGGSPRGRGDALLDTRGAVLLDHTEVVLVDREPGSGKPPAAMLVLSGRVNFERRRSQTAYLFGTDGAAAIVSELTELAARAGGDYARGFQTDLERRLKEMP